MGVRFPQTCVGFSSGSAFINAVTATSDFKVLLPGGWTGSPFSLNVTSQPINMSVTSDITINAAVFQEASIDESTKKLNQTLAKSIKSALRWYEVGAAQYRQMVYEGKTPFPVPALLANAQDATVPSRDPGRDIPVRYYKPDNGNPSKGLYLYFHGGGFVMGSHREWVFLYVSMKSR